MRYLLHDVFTDSVKTVPNNTAIINEDGTRISYLELNERSNQYAHILMSLKEDVRSNPYVGILSCVNKESIAGILGCLKIGCAYVPLDEYSPVERLHHIIKNTKLNIILLDSIWFEKYRELIECAEIETVILLDNKLSYVTNYSKKIILHSEVIRYSVMIKK